jgi:hypothetical protein
MPIRCQLLVLGRKSVELLLEDDDRAEVDFSVGTSWNCPSLSLRSNLALSQHDSSLFFAFFAIAIMPPLEMFFDTPRILMFLL